MDATDWTTQRVEARDSARAQNPATEEESSSPFVELLTLRCDELDVLFKRSRTVELSALSGAHDGRMLAVRGLDFRGAGWLVRQLASTRAMWWQGKLFPLEPTEFRSRADPRASTTVGRGLNRVRFPFRGPTFPFRFQHAESVVDGRPCVSFDYDLPENPRPLRAAYDELREVQPGIYLGRGMYRRERARPTLLLWFALAKSS